MYSNLYSIYNYFFDLVFRDRKLLDINVDFSFWIN
jgi:hypothetical protein